MHTEYLNEAINFLIHLKDIFNLQHPHFIFCITMIYKHENNDIAKRLGTIMKIEAFGAFVEMAGTRFQGLVHISQLAKDRVENINEVVTVNDEVFVKVHKHFISHLIV